MELWQIILVVLVVAVLVAAGAWLLMKRRRTGELTEQFGPEYQRTLEERGNRAEAERELAERQERVEKMQIRDLEPGERERFVTAWRSVQAQFVDDPGGAIGKADALLRELMTARGYAVDGDFERMAADVSVHHGDVVGEYREAHAIAERHANGETETEDLRQAMVHYRALADDLLQSQQMEATGANA